MHERSLKPSLEGGEEEPDFIYPPRYLTSGLTIPITLKVAEALPRVT